MAIRGHVREHSVGPVQARLGAVLGRTGVQLWLIVGAMAIWVWIVTAAFGSNPTWLPLLVSSAGVGIAIALWPVTGLARTFSLWMAIASGKGTIFYDERTDRFVPAEWVMKAFHDVRVAAGDEDVGHGYWRFQKSGPHGRGGIDQFSLTYRPGPGAEPFPEGISFKMSKSVQADGVLFVVSGTSRVGPELYADGKLIMLFDHSHDFRDEAVIYGLASVRAVSELAVARLVELRNEKKVALYGLPARIVFSTEGLNEGLAAMGIAPLSDNAPHE